MMMRTTASQYFTLKHLKYLLCLCMCVHGCLCACVPCVQGCRHRPKGHPIPWRRELEKFMNQLVWLLRTPDF